MKNNPHIVSVILARGGSKGIPRKNIIDLCGKPLISYAIAASCGAGIDETWVSTDDAEIASVAKRYGARVLNRPAELASDTASSEAALLHFAKKVTFDWLVFIQPTSPLIESGDIARGLAMMESGQFDSVFSAYVEHWMGTWNERAEPKGWNIFHRPRRQEVGTTLRENGAFYIAKKENLLASGLRYSGRMGIVKMPFSRSFQIDTLEDLEFISRIMKN